MELLQLQLLVSLSKTLNFTRTAKLFYITQPAVSYHLKALENELGVQLFIRDTHNTSFTEAGLEMLSYAVDICDIEMNARQRMKNIAEGRTGHLSVALLQDYTMEVSELVFSFSREFPCLQIDTHIMEGSELIRSIQNEEYDFYFAIDSMIAHNSNYQCIVTKKQSMEIYLHEKTSELFQAEQWDFLSAVPFLSISPSDTPLFNRVNTIMENNSFRPCIIHYYNRIDSILLSVNSGIGFSILPAGLCSLSRFPQIRTVPLSDPEAYLTSAIGYKKRNYTEAAFRFLKMIQER